MKQWEIMIYNNVLLFSVTNEETPYEQPLHYWGQLGISFGSVFFLFSNESSQEPHSEELGKIPSPRHLIACENSCFSLLLAAGNVKAGGTSVTQ